MADDTPVAIAIWDDYIDKTWDDFYEDTWNGFNGERFQTIGFFIPVQTDILILR